MGTLAGILMWAGLSAVVGAVAADLLYAVNVRDQLIPGRRPCCWSPAASVSPPVGRAEWIRWWRSGRS